MRWGWRAAEAAELPPGLPLVVLQRTLANAASWWSMCADEAPVADISVQVHTWHPNYEAARALSAQVRAIVLGAGDWRLSAETDDYEPSFRSWRIAGDYINDSGLPVE